MSSQAENTHSVLQYKVYPETETKSLVLAKRFINGETRLTHALMLETVNALIEDIEYHQYTTQQAVDAMDNALSVWYPSNSTDITKKDFLRAASHDLKFFLKNDKARKEHSQQNTRDAISRSIFLTKQAD